MRAYRWFACTIMASCIGCNRTAPPASAPGTQPKPAVASEATDLTLGAVLPLTGTAAVYGGNSRKGIELAVEEENAHNAGNGKKVRVIFEDSKGDARTGVAAVEKLITVDKVPVIFDDAVSTVALAALPIIDRARVAYISTGSTNPNLSGRSSFFFRTWNSDVEEGRFSATYARDKLGLRRGAALYVENDYGKGLFDEFKRNFESHGGQMPAFEVFPPDASDFRPQVTKLIAAGPEFIYIISYPELVPTILRQLAERNYRGRLLGSTTMEDPKILKDAAATAEGLTYPFPTPPSGMAVDQFKHAFRKKFGEDPGTCAAEGYDNARMVLHVMSKGARTGEQVRDGLRGLVRWPGASGEITFDERGDVHKPMGMKKVTNGAFVAIP